MSKVNQHRRQEAARRYTAENEGRNKKSKNDATKAEEQMTDNLTDQIATKIGDDCRKNNLGRSASGSHSFGPPEGGWPGMEKK